MAGIPPEACPPGQMAVPGETSCREVAPCGDGPWGTIPVEATTQFVDQAYAGGDSDGTMAKPWTSVQQGIDAAAGGAIVAVTDGVYAEDVRIEGKAVQLWGRCPALVEIRGTGGHPAAVEIFRSDADGSEIRGLAVTGVGAGIGVSGASDVRIEQVWVHDAWIRGIDIDGAYGPTSVTVQGSLVEQNHDMGVLVAGSDAELLATVVRATQPVNGQGGRGVYIQDDPVMGQRARVGIDRCVVEQNHAAGIAVRGSDADLGYTVVRDTAANNDGLFGDGIIVENGAAKILSAAVSGSARAGVANFGSDVTILSSTITCNAIDIIGETHNGIPFSFDGSTGWQCSRAGAEDCTETDTCHVLSAGLESPPPSEPLPQP